MCNIPPEASTRPRSPTVGDGLRLVINVLPDQIWMTPWDLKVCRVLAACGTGLLGWSVSECVDCHARKVHGLNCQSRYCPSCGAKKSLEWVEAREEELIDAPYFHYVFTLPGDFYGLIRRYPSLLLNFLMRTVGAVLKAFSADEKYLGATAPIWTMLHTTNRRMGYHPHVHVVIAGGGIREETGEYIQMKNEKYLFPARALASSFRGRLLSGLRGLVASGALPLSEEEQEELEKTISKHFKVNWQVRTKRAFGGARQVVRYLARYTHRTAISNNRIKKVSAEGVTFTYKDRGTGKTRYRTVSPMTFAKMFAKHILPKGFKRVRFYGALAPGKRKRLLPQIQEASAAAARLRGETTKVKPLLKQEILVIRPCERCGSTKPSTIIYQTLRTKAPEVFPQVLPRPPPEVEWALKQEAP